MRHRAATALFATACLLPAALAAPAAGQEPAERPFQADKALPLLSVDFPGGNAAEYVEALRDAAGDINAVVAPEARDVRMPPVSLRQVTVAAAIGLLENRKQEKAGRGVRLSVRRLPTYTRGEQPTFEIRATPYALRETERRARVWSLAYPVDNGVSARSILSAVETALELVESAEPPVVRFHEDTRVLIGTGTHQQMEVIEGVLDRLHESVGDPCAERFEALHQQLEAVKRDREDLADRLDAARRRAGALQHEIQVREAELTQAMLRLEAAQRELSEKRSDRDPDAPR